jgi:hypothetical protein
MPDPQSGWRAGTRAFCEDGFLKTFGQKQNRRVRQGKKLSILLTVKPLHGSFPAESAENQASCHGGGGTFAGL